jgi:tetratricopeptide (TPR) repeat protein
MKCSKCGGENPDRARVCMQCGSALVVKCANCGQENPKPGKEYDHNRKYCLKCGAILTDERKLDTLICYGCGTANEPDLIFCKKCGTQLTAKEPPTAPQAKKEMVSPIENGSELDPSPEMTNGELFSQQRKKYAEPEDIMKKAGHQSGGLSGIDFFDQSLKMILSDQGTRERRIELLNKALVHGLPANDEIKARAFLGAELFNIGDDEEAFKQYEESLKLASSSGSMFKDNTMVLLCRKLCLKYVLIARKIEGERGLEECLAFLESKAADLKDLSSPALYVELATLHAKNGDVQEASIYFSKATMGHRVDPMDRKAENLAWESLSKIKKTAKSRHANMTGQGEFRLDISPKTMGVAKKVLEQIRESIVSQVQNKKNFPTYIMAAIILGILIIGGILVASYLSSSKLEPPVSSVPEKTQPPQSVEVPKLEETPEPLPEPLPAPAAVSTVEPPRARPRETAKTAKTEKRPKKTVPKISERTIDRPSEPQRGKSFAPRSRDDL